MEKSQDSRLDDSLFKIVLPSVFTRTKKTENAKKIKQRNTNLGFIMLRDRVSQAETARLTVSNS